MRFISYNDRGGLSLNHFEAILILVDSCGVRIENGVSVPKLQPKSVSDARVFNLLTSKRLLVLVVLADLGMLISLIALHQQ